MTKLYQIIAEGDLDGFSGTHRFHSGRVFTETPSKEEINDFIDACCDEETFVHLKRDTVKTKIAELKLIDNKFT